MGNGADMGGVYARPLANCSPSGAHLRPLSSDFRTTLTNKVRVLGCGSSPGLFAAA